MWETPVAKQHEDLSFIMTEVTITSGKTAFVHFNLDGRKVHVPVDADIKAYFN
jgi:hypothetical protein